MAARSDRRHPDLRAYWSRRERDVMFWRSAHEGGSANAAYLHHVIGGDFLRELDRRGFDTTTLRFSIRRKPGLEGCRSCFQHPHKPECLGSNQHALHPTPQGQD